MKNNHNQVTNSIENRAKRTAVPRRYFSIAIVLIAVSMLAPQRAQAAAGDLDSRFGSGGVAVTDFAQTDDYAYAVTVQADGRIIVSGQSGIYPDLHTALVRYTRNGRLDLTFGTGGKVAVNLDPGGDYLDALVM